MESNTSDSLLDFGDDSLSPPSAPLGVPEGGVTDPEGGGVTDSTSNGGDPFDPFGGFGEGSFTTNSDTLQPTSLGSSDPFDPFAVLSNPEPAPKMAATEEQTSYDAQFADLLGDLSGTTATTNGIVNGNDESVTTVTKTTTIENDSGDVVKTTTVTTETGQGEGSQVQEPSTPTGDAYNTDTYEQTSTYATDRPSSARTSRVAAAFEDTLQDYQPPKRYVKKDENAKETKGPSVFITESNETTVSANKKLSRKISVTEQSPSSANEEAEEVKPSHPFGSLLATWSANEGGQSRDTPKEKPSKPIRYLGAGTDNMCKKCDKRVYEMEKIIADKAIYHKPCFRCVHCQRVLTLGNYAAIDEKPYCKPHFIELFKKKGKYDMGKTKDTPPPRQETPKVEAQPEQRTASPATRVNGSRDEEEEEEEEREEPKKEEN